MVISCCERVQSTCRHKDNMNQRSRNGWMLPDRNGKRRSRDKRPWRYVSVLYTYTDFFGTNVVVASTSRTTSNGS